MLSFAYLSLLLCLSSRTIGESITINNMTDFWKFYDGSQSGTQYDSVTLNCDLNFTNEARQMEHPLFKTHVATSVQYGFNGTFEGNWHTVSGLNITVEHKSGSDAGFFYMHFAVRPSTIFISTKPVCSMARGLVHLQQQSVEIPMCILKT